MKKLITLLIIIASFGCSNQESVESESMQFDLTIDDPYSYSPVLTYYDSLMGEATYKGVITRIESVMFRHGDTLVLDEHRAGALRKKSPYEKIENCTFIGTVSKIDSGYWTEYGTVGDINTSK